MNQGGYVTLVGYVAREPMLRATKEGTLVADMRIGTASRYFDKKTGEWQDGDCSYFTVTCWRRLATAAKISLRKGEPVIVRGRFRTRAYIDREGVRRTEVEVTAEAFGHDLTKGVATFVQRGIPRDTMLQPRRDGDEAQVQAGAGEAGDDDEAGLDRDEYLADDGTSEDGPGDVREAASAMPTSTAPTSTAPDRFISDPAVAEFARRYADTGEEAGSASDVPAETTAAL